MTHRDSPRHLSAEALQALLDGDLPARERIRAEEHLAGCARCSGEVEAWRALLQDLDALPMLRPAERFAERVLAEWNGRTDLLGVAAREAHHVEADLLQEYLDGVLGRRRAAAVEAHLAACGSCRDEAHSWTALYGRLSGLARHAPDGGFVDRVIGRLDLPGRAPLAARVRARVAALLPTGREGHLRPGRLQDFVEGVLPAGQMVRARAHLDGCSACGAEATAWQAVMARLGGLERPAPAPGFAERVMAGVRLAAQAPVAARRPVLAHLLARARRYVPRTREAWAAISGMAVTPAVVTGLVLYVVFSHPAVTPGTLASFLWWQVVDLAGAGWTVVSTAALESAQLFGVYSIFGALASAPFAVAGGVLAYSLMSALALRVIYKTFIANRPMDGRHVFSAS